VPVQSAGSLSPDSSTGPAAGVGSTGHRNTADAPAETAAGPFRSGSTVRPGYRGPRHAHMEQGSGRRDSDEDIALRPDPAGAKRRSDSRGHRARSDPNHGRMAADERGHGIARLGQGSLRQDRCNSASRRHAQLNGQCCGGNADDHGPSPIKPEAAGVSTTRRPVARSRSRGCCCIHTDIEHALNTR